MDFLKDFFSKLQISGYNEAMTREFTSQAIIFGIITALLCLFAAFAVKKAQALGVFAAATSLLTTILTPKYVEVFHTLEFVKYIYGSSQAELDAKLAEYYASLIPKYIVMFGFSACLILTIVFTILLAVKLMKVNSKLFGVFALIVAIARYVFISPVPMFSSILNGGTTVAAQESQLTIFFIAGLIPAALLAVGSLITLVSPKKVEAAPVEETAETAPVTAEAPVEEAAVEEAPVEEATTEAVEEETVTADEN